MFRFKFFALQFALTLALRAQIVPDQFIVELSGDPAIASSASSEDHRRVRTEMVSRRVAVRAQQARVRQSVARVATVLDSVELVANAFIVEGADADALRAIPGVARVLPVYELHPVLDVMSVIHHVPEAMARVGGMDKAGAGIKIGILDSGIDVDHAGFQDNTLPALDGYPRVSDEQIRGAMSKKIIVGRAYDSLNRVQQVNLDIEDRVGHGTAVAMVAAGVTNIGPYGPITGFAPKAYLGVYRVFSGSTLRNSVILKALDDAVSDGMDIVNMSFGSPLALRSDLDVVVDAVERASSAGVIVVVAGGNSGPDSYTVGTSDAPSSISAGASYNARQFAAGILLGDQTVIGIPGSGPNSEQPVTAALFDAATSSDPEGKLCNSAANGAFKDRIVLIYRGDCFFEVKLNNAQAAGAIAAVVYSSQASPGRILMNAGSATLPAIMVDYGDGVNIKDRLKAGSATATLQFSALVLAQPSNRLAEFSSHGPSVDANIKPDLIAVGTDVYTAAQSKFKDGDVYDKSGYLVLDGTSFSSPATAGAMALLKAGRPGLKPSQYRSLLVNSASALILADGSTAPVMAAGAGLLNLDAAVQSTTALAPVSSSFGIGDGNPDRSRIINVTNLSNITDTFRISVSTNDATPAVTDAQALEIGPGETKAFNLSFRGKALASGEFQGFVKVKGDNAAVEARMAYWYGSTNGAAAKVNIIKQPFAASVNTTTSIDFVLSDRTGMPLTGGAQPGITITSGGGSLRTVDLLEPVYPGVWEINVRLGATPGPNVVHVEMGDAKRDIIVIGQ